MMIRCTRCGHESWCHQNSVGKCEAVNIESESDFYEVEIAPGLKAVTQDVEYGDDCTCQEFTTRKTAIKIRAKVKEGLDRFL